MKRDFKYLRTYIKRVVSDEDALISDNHLYDDIIEDIDTYNDEVKKYINRIDDFEFVSNILAELDEIIKIERKKN